MATMSVVTFCDTNSMYEKEYSRHVLLKKSLISEKVPLEDIIHVTNKDGRQDIKLLLQGERPLGNTNWNVYYHRPTDLEQRVMDLERRQTKTDTAIMNELIQPLIRNTAANIILFFLGTQPYTSPQSYKFSGYSEGVQENRAKLALFIDTKSLNCSVKIWGGIMDNIITKRNKCIHPLNWDLLGEEVAKCMAYVDDFPQLETMLKDEILILTHFPKFREFIEEPPSVE